MARTNSEKFNELIKLAYKNAVEKGWWSAKRNPHEMIMLMISELSEGIEAHRKNKRADVKAFDEEIKEYPNGFVNAFRTHIKDTVEDEFADTLIRIADTCGGYEVNELSIMDDPSLSWIPDVNFGENLLNITRDLCCIYDNDQNTIIKEAVEDVVDSILGICSEMEIDIWNHISMKQMFNETRERKHGKLY